VKSRRPWTVTPHSAIEKLDENLWAVSSAIPGVPMPRRMMIVKRSDARLLFFHAVPLDDAALAEVKAFGEPAYLVIAHHQHGIDADAFQKKLGLKLYGPKADLEKMRRKLDLDGTLEDIPPDRDVDVVSTPGVTHGEPIITVRSPNGSSLLFSDVVMNVKSGGLMMRLAGFVGGPKCNAFFRWRFITDKPAVKAHLEKLAATPGLKTLVPCHGDVVREGAAQAMQQIAAGL
jgi:hypothetical protein